MPGKTEWCLARKFSRSAPTDSAHGACMSSAPLCLGCCSLLLAANHLKWQNCQRECFCPSWVLAWLSWLAALPWLLLAVAGCSCLVSRARARDPEPEQPAENSHGEARANQGRPRQAKASYDEKQQGRTKGSQTQPRPGKSSQQQPATNKAKRLARPAKPRPMTARNSLKLPEA